MPRKQFKRANRMLKKLRTYLDRVIRDIGRKSRTTDALEVKFRKACYCCAARPRAGSSISAGPCAGSRMHRQGQGPSRYEFGVKVSVATTLKHCKGGQFVTHVKALPGNPYDGHNAGNRDPGDGALAGNTIARILADKDIAATMRRPDRKFRVFLSGQKRGVTPKIKRELRRRAAVEPVIGHLKSRAPHGPQTISGSGRAMPIMPSSPPPVTTSAASFAG